MINIPIDLEGLLESDQVMLVVPMRHPTKGVASIRLAVTREFLTDQLPALTAMIDDGITYYAETIEGP